MNNFLFNADNYLAYRPFYPKALFNYLQQLCTNDCYALDCGTGNGQAAIGLSNYFKHVIATDFSYALLSKSQKISNVVYLQSKAEKLPIQSQSIDIICIAQAMHWFSLENFYEEVKRILKPGGIIAAWCYNQSTINPEMDKLLDEIYEKITSAENISHERQYVYDHYQTIHFPFNRIIPPTFKMTANWNLTQLLGYIQTWPSILEYEKKHGIDLILEMSSRFLSTCTDHNHIKISWPIYLLIGKMDS